MATKLFLISESAAKQIKHLLEKNNQPDNTRMRVTVDGGGCSGFQYSFNFDNKLNPDDVVFNKNDIEVVTDTISLGFLDNAELTYINELGASAFKIINPNAIASCGCGNSFSVDLEP